MRLRLSEILASGDSASTAQANLVMNTRRKETSKASRGMTGEARLSRWVGTCRVIKTMEMKSTLRLIQEAVGTEKFIVLAAAVDGVKADQESIRRDVKIDDEIETLDLATLASDYGVNEKTLRDQIEKELGLGVVMKIGKKWVIRKRRFLDYMIQKENRATLVLS